MKSPNFSFDSNSLLFKLENSSSEIVSAKTLRCDPVRSIYFKSLWQHVLTLLSGRREPRIWRNRDRTGNWYFRVFDPATGASSVFDSEQEVRVWLEQRYSAK